MKKGLISFILVLIFILIYFNLVYSVNSFNSKKDSSEADLIEMENTSFKRNLIENAVDSLIEEKIKKEIAFGSDNPEIINKKISGELDKLFNEINENEFKEIKSEKKYSKTEILGKKVSEKFIEENTKTIVFGLEDRLYEVRFIYTGGINKNNLIGSKITENNSEQKFFIPVNYSVKVISLRFVG